MTIPHIVAVWHHIDLKNDGRINELNTIKRFSIIATIITCSIIILFFLSHANAVIEAQSFAKPRLAEFEVKDLVTKQPVEGVTVHFSPAYCHAEDIFLSGYDYMTCNGVYNELPKATSNKNGIVAFKLTKRHPRHIRLSIDAPENYKNTVMGTYELASLEKGQIIWLIERGKSGLKIPTSEAAVQYLAEQPIIKIMEEFYGPRKIRVDIEKLALGTDEEDYTTWYGLWRLRTYISSNIDDSGVVPDITVYIHPVTGEYLMCGGKWENHLQPEAAQLPENVRSHECNPVMTLLGERKRDEQYFPKIKVQSENVIMPAENKAERDASIQILRGFESIARNKIQKDISLIRNLMEQGTFPVHIPIRKSFEPLTMPDTPIDMNEYEDSNHLWCSSHKAPENTIRYTRNKSYYILGTPKADTVQCVAKKSIIAHFDDGDDDIYLDTVDNIIVNAGAGNDKIWNIGQRNILIFDQNWGNDILKMSCGGSVPFHKIGGWEKNPSWNHAYKDFLIFGRGIFEQDIEINNQTNTILNKKTGDSINVKGRLCFNIIFSERS